MHEEQIQSLQNQVSLIPELKDQARELEYDADVLQRDLDDVHVRCADLDAERQESTDMLSATRDENVRLAEQVALLEGHVSRLPALECDVQVRQDRIQDLDTHLDDADAERRYVLAQLRRALGNENGFWDDAPLSSKPFLSRCLASRIRC